MKKLIWSTFAVSLMLFSSGGWSQTESIDDFLGLETEVLPQLIGKQKFTGVDFHESPELQVVATDVVKDVPEPVKGQGYSIIPWSTQDPEEWMDIHKWLVQREIKDKNADWKLRLRREEHRELVGKVIHCFGTCIGFRGTNKTPIQYLSRLEEGDEIQTETDSVLWVYLLDGSLLRLSPGTSLSLQEINLSSDEVFTLMRLNQGHIFYHARNREELATDLSPETDAVSLPLMIREANQQYFERKIFQVQNESEHLAEVINLEEKAIKDQFSKINALKNSNNKKFQIKNKVMVVSSNMSLLGSQTSFDFLHMSGGKSYFKKRGQSEESTLSLYLRGYSNTQEYPVASQDWQEVEVTGRSFNKVENVPSTLTILELLTKRIKTMELAREMWLKKFSLPVFDSITDAKKLAVNHGYHQWGDDYFKRIEFLVEYTRRIETTHLRSVENLLNKLRANGEKVVTEISSDFYHHSLNHYLMSQKSRFESKKLQVKEMTNLQYYVWILKDGKF